MKILMNKRTPNNPADIPEVIGNITTVIARVAAQNNQLFQILTIRNMTPMTTAAVNNAIIISIAIIYNAKSMVFAVFKKPEKKLKLYF
jgi:hypothetical protein